MLRFWIAIVCALAVAAMPVGVDARPNIVFIYADDHAAWAMGRAGHPNAHTPNMDRLAAGGAYFRNSFVVTPVCSPSRAELATSRYGTELGITDWIRPKDEHEIGLDPRTVTWYELLQQAGYQTGLVGKWHLGVPERYHPTRTGFDEFVGFLEGGTSTKDPTLEIKGEKVKCEGLTTDLLTDHAIDFLKRHREGPFLLCLHHRAPHTAYMPVSDEDWSHYKDIDPHVPNPDFPNLDIGAVKKNTREYLASVSGIDRNLGRVLDTLEDLELADNTIVIYTSDHGYNIGHHGLHHKGNASWILTTTRDLKWGDPRRHRSNLFDTSLRVPVIVRWPDVVKAGTTIPQVTSNVDWFPTICEMAGVDVPRNLTIRGHSFAPMLKGERIAWNNDLYVEYSQHHYVTMHMRAYRTPEWKLIRDFLNPGRDELYHLARDPDEMVNLIESDDKAVRAKRIELDQKMMAAMWEVRDPVVRQP